MPARQPEWYRFNPTIEDSQAQEILLKFVDALSIDQRALSEAELNQLITALKAPLNNSFDSLKVKAALGILRDLALQGWHLRISEESAIEVKQPSGERGTPLAEKERVRRQELLKRDEQLREPAIRKFIQEMERGVIYQNKRVSIFSLFRDGRELAQSLREARGYKGAERSERLSETIRPYLQFVDDKSRCPQTGFRLQDIWRYFRHTWTNYYTTSPGRTLAFIVRDAARDYHPVIGIGALGSAIIQLKKRDDWIEWQPDFFIQRAKEAPFCNLLGEWLLRGIERALSETYIEDLLAEEFEGKLLITLKQIAAPSADDISRLSRYGENQRERHHRYVNRSQFKNAPRETSREHWVSRAESHLYKSKRAQLLAEMLRCRLVLREHLSSSPTLDQVQRLLNSSDGKAVVTRILRRVKSERVGISIADITVCGATEPYRAVLGGKLISLLAASPEVVSTYQKKYSEHPSEIASSTAGRPIYRPAELVFLGTTSLYGVGASQYNRVKIPVDALGGSSNDHIEYIKLGYSCSYGTSQFSADTLRDLTQLVQQSKNGVRVNSIFGEGVSPKLRKLREGLDLLGVSSDHLLQHGRERIIYGVPLIRNLRPFLLGFEEAPDYLFPLSDPKKSTEDINRWWIQRWLSKRIDSDEVLSRVQEHTLIYPIKHGARVSLPPVEEFQGSLFEDLA